jgi:hypothetical protein
MSFSNKCRTFLNPYVVRLLCTYRVNSLIKCVCFEVDTVFFTPCQFTSSQQSCIENVKVIKFKVLCFSLVNISFVVISTNDMLIKILAALK